MQSDHNSQIALVLSEPIENLSEVMTPAVASGDVDRFSPIDDGTHAAEVLWGGRTERGAVRVLEHGIETVAPGQPLLRSEVRVAQGGPVDGIRRQAELLRALTRQVGDRVAGVIDLSSGITHDVTWINKAAAGRISFVDLVRIEVDGDGAHWIHTHGAARFGVPDLELYDVDASRVPAGQAGLLQLLEDMILGAGLRADLRHPTTGVPIHLVPLLEAWPRLDRSLPGVGRVGGTRGVDLEGPRATCSLTHKRRFGRVRPDFEGFVDQLASN